MLASKSDIKRNIVWYSFPDKLRWDCNEGIKTVTIPEGFRFHNVEPKISCKQLHKEFMSSDKVFFNADAKKSFLPKQVREKAKDELECVEKKCFRKQRFSWKKAFRHRLDF